MGPAYVVSIYVWVGSYMLCTKGWLWALTYVTQNCRVGPWGVQIEKTFIYEWAYGTAERLSLKTFEWARGFWMERNYIHQWHHGWRTSDIPADEKCELEWQKDSNDNLCLHIQKCLPEFRNGTSYMPADLNIG